MTEKASKTREIDLSLRRVQNSPAAPRNLRLLQTLLDAPSGKPAVARIVNPELIPVVEAGEPRRGFINKLRLRHGLIGLGFFALVAVPSVITTAYMAFVAADQYHSSGSFSVRSIDSAQAADLLGMFSQSSSGSTVSDSYVLLDYILSERMVQLVDEAFGLDHLYAPRGADYYFGITGGTTNRGQAYLLEEYCKCNFRSEFWDHDLAN